MQKLLDLLSIPGPCGDEGATADWLETQLGGRQGVVLHRLGDNLIAVRGAPRTAIFAHTDTTGFTLGYRRRLIPLGAPSAADKDPLRSSDGLLYGRLRSSGCRNEHARLSRVRDSAGAKRKPSPGTRWVYARKPKITNGLITAPYLDNRAGVWAAWETLERCEHAAVAFTTGEERHGHGARVCSDWLYREHRISQAIIADLTWHTPDTPCGKGVVISLRDAYAPRQAFLNRVLSAAADSHIPHQREIQSAGSSDGGHLLRSATPIDWVFVGAPEKHPHTDHERTRLIDLEAMADMLAWLLGKLHEPA